MEKVVYQRLLACGMMVLVVASWVAMAEFIQGIQHPIFFSYFIHSSFAIFLAGWPLARLLRSEGNEPLELPKGVSWRRVALVSLPIGVLFWLHQATWCESLQRTTIAGNTAVYNAGPVIVFMFSVCILREKVTKLKVLATLFTVGGIMIITFITSSNDKNPDEAVLGYVLVTLSCCCYSLYEVVFAKYCTHEDDDNMLHTSILYFGLFGLACVVCVTPIMLIVHFTGYETLDTLDSDEGMRLLATILLECIFQSCLVMAIALTSPLFVAVGSTFTIPTALIWEYVYRNVSLPPLSYLGVALVIIGFVLLNIQFSSDADEEPSSPSGASDSYKNIYGSNSLCENLNGDEPSVILPPSKSGNRWVRSGSESEMSRRSSSDGTPVKNFAA